MNKRRVLVLVIGILVLLGSIVFLLRDTLFRQLFKPTDTSLETTDIGDSGDTTVVTRGLDVPWEITFLPGGDLLVTERPGTLKRVGTGQRSYEIDGVEHIGEGGLLGLALHPDFAQNRWLYIYQTTETEGGLINRVDRYQLRNDQLSDRETVFDTIPGALYHDGGRIAFGPEGYLYITTGDAGNPDLAQDRDSLAGKILRINDDGSIPSDNPFGTAVYTYGHRNPQGLAWDNQGRLWQTEHGPSGNDELNLIRPGNNYGWPAIVGDDTQEGMDSPVQHSGDDETWAPAGMAYIDGSLFYAGLRGEGLYEARIKDDTIVDTTLHLRSEYGRLRAVTLGPDNHLYVSTSNTDGRGDERPDDDKVIRINPRIFR